jgi:hypothetical protein
MGMLVRVLDCGYGYGYGVALRLTPRRLAVSSFRLALAPDTGVWWERHC